MKLRFTVRDLFWLVLVAALAVGWWLDHSNLTKQPDQQWPPHGPLKRNGGSEWMW
jgi:hypothetical protein